MEWRAGDESDGVAGGDNLKKIVCDVCVCQKGIRAQRATM